MKFEPGDKVRVVCDTVGIVQNDPTRSEFSIVVKFGDQLARLPNDGTLLGMKHMRLVKINEEESTYELT